MPVWTKLKRLCGKDWFLALLLLGIYLATNRYVYAWDDQHLEIPLLKHLIDPTLYKGDYYVESLARNFTTYMFPLLAKVITVAEVPAAYLILFLISRFYLFYWSFKLWDLLARRYFGSSCDVCSPRLAAFCAVVMSVLIGRTEEFLYRTFSHQEFALGIIAAAIYYFYKERFILAAFLFGLSANFHALYALFPMTYMSFYLLFFHPERRIGNFIRTGLTFVIACLPFLLWAIPHNIDLHMHTPPDLTKDWIAMYYLACPQNFPFADAKVPEVLADFKLLMSNIAPFLMMIVLYIFHMMFNVPFRRDRKIRAIAIAVAMYIVACFYLAYGHPMRFALDLNLIRNEQFLRFFMMGYTSVFVAYKVRERTPLHAILLSVIFLAVWFKGPLGLFLVTSGSLCLTALEWNDLPKTWDRWKLIVLAAVLLVIAALAFHGINWPMIRKDKVGVELMVVAALVLYSLWIFLTKRKRIAEVFVAVPLAFAFLFFCYYHYQYVQVTTKGGGFWQLERNWMDMQRYVRDHTPKDALILTPYNTEMGGFRIISERKVLVSYRDCGIVGFDYKAALEWRRRVLDVEPFKVFVEPSSIAPAIVSALYKYKVDYIVFMRYYAPDDNQIVKKMYENEVFSLYKVIQKQD